MMLQQLVLVGALVGALGADAAATQAASSARQGAGAPSAVLGTVRLTKNVLANGKPLPAGTYQVRLSDEAVKPAVGQTPDAERWVEFVKDGQVVGRELATVVNADEIGQVAKGRRPQADSSSVEMLKGGDYWRVWINKGGKNYIINLPPAA